MKKILLFFVFAPYFVSCSGIQETNPDEPVYADSGNEFEIVLGSNPSTGYHWVILKHPEKKTAAFVTEEYEPDNKIIKAVGSGGKSVFIFKALNPGETRVTIGYFGPYDDPDTDEPVFTAGFIIFVTE